MVLWQGVAHQVTSDKKDRIPVRPSPDFHTEQNRDKTLSKESRDLGEVADLSPLFDLTQVGINLRCWSLNFHTPVLASNGLSQQLS